MEENREINELIGRVLFGWTGKGYFEHVWKLNDYNGEIDIFALEYGYHNGPACTRCEHSFCHHCNENGYTDNLPCAAPLADYTGSSYHDNAIVNALAERGVTIEYSGPINLENIHSAIISAAVEYCTNAERGMIIH